MAATTTFADGFSAMRRLGSAAAALAAAVVLATPASAAELNNRLNRNFTVEAGAPTVGVLHRTRAVSLGQRSRGGGGGGGTAVPRGGGASGGSRAGSSSGTSGGSSTGGSSAGGATTRDGAGSTSGGSVGTATERTRDGRPSEGEAVGRPPAPPTVIVPGGGYYGGYYPWGWGGLGLWGYYGFYDPWLYEPYPPVGGGYSSGYGYEGALKLKVKPREAEVYVDGYYAGSVDDFDGVFQSLKLDSGPHRVEVRLQGYEPLSFDVNILPNRTTTYKGELKKSERADTGEVN